MKTLKRYISLIIYFFLLLFILIKKKFQNKKKYCDLSDLTIIFFAGLGDFLVLCNFLKQIYENNEKMILVCSNNNGVSELANKLGYFDNIYELNNNYKYRITNILKMFKINSKKVVTMPPQRHILTDIYNLSINSQYHIVANTNMGCSSIFLKKVVDKKIDKLIDINSILEIDRYFEYFKGMGYNYVLPKIFKFNYIKIKEKVKDIPYIISIFPGASGSPSKCWSLENYIWVINNLSKNYNNLIFNIMGTSKEISMGNTIISNIYGNVKIKNLCGNTNIEELIRYLSDSTLVLANDSGGAHLSIACNVPTIIIAGLWEYGRFYPNYRLDKIHIVEIADHLEFDCFNCKESQPNCSKNDGPADCINSVKKEKVLYDIQQKLEEIFNAHSR